MSLFQRLAARFKRMFGDDAGMQERVDPTDAMSAARTQHYGQDLTAHSGGAPPNWVPPADEGRPRH